MNQPTNESTMTIINARPKYRIQEAHSLHVAARIAPNYILIMGVEKTTERFIVVVVVVVAPCVCVCVMHPRIAAVVVVCLRDSRVCICVISIPLLLITGVATDGGE
mmetsp:Transcript_23673/g.36401  ORF Transcript_23673/g.36401 Transcript_23673/m.36401 type:complete len:106 (-) Transcript_23673:778-1095(-)